MNQLFMQAIRETFPKLEAAQQEKIYTKVSLHMLEKVKDAAYRNNPKALGTLETLIKNEPDVTKRSQEYARKIFMQFDILPKQQKRTHFSTTR